LSKLLELFDEFARPIYAEKSLKLGHEAKEFILVIDDYTKKATIQLNVFDDKGDLYENPSEIDEHKLYNEIMDYLRSVLYTKYSKDPEHFFADEIYILMDYINAHIRDAFFNPELDVFIMQLDIE